ncbi:MAG: hypothetical protein ACSLFP_17185 [Acidimicrobiales bacterium]
MARQLTLLEAPPTWQIDESTREVGRRGLAEARATLQAALAAEREQAPVHDHPHHDRSAA